MTISTTANVTVQNGNGATTQFPFTFLIPSATSVIVLIEDATVTPSSFTTLSPAQYYIAGIGNVNGGLVAYPLTGPPLAAGHKIHIIRAVPYTQTTDLSNQGNFDADVVEEMSDKIVMQVQQLASAVSEAVAGATIYLPSTTLPIWRVNQATSNLEFSYDGGATWSAGTGQTFFLGRGAYASGVFYNLTDTVTSGGAGYVCTTAHLSAGAIDLTKWQLIYSPTIGLPAAGQCQLQYVDGTHIKLVPWNGNNLQVAGVQCTVPDAGVTADATGVLAGGTNYYVYAVAAGGVVTSLELSTTIPVADTAAGNKGVQIKTGDNTRTLVGLVYNPTLGGYSNSATVRGVRSWFNDPGVAVNGALAADKTTASGTYVKLDSATDLIILLWANELVQAWVDAIVSNATGATDYTSIGFDGVVAEDASGATYIGANAGGVSVVTPSRSLSAGAHSVSLLGATSGATTGTWKGAAYSGTSTPSVRSSFGARSFGVNP